MITAIILARKGSKRLPDKNFRPFCGKSLLDWAIIKALRSKLIEEIIVSTDREDFVFEHVDVKIDKRPSELARDDVSPEVVIRYLREKYHLKGILVLLDPCSPFKAGWLIDKAITLHLETGKTVVSVRKGNRDPNGVLYVFSTESVWDIEGEIIPVEMGNIESIHIDFIWQFRIAEHYFSELGYIR